MENYLVYILKCADGTLYTGITNDLKKRLATHNQGKASKYTRVRLPVKLIYKEAGFDRSTSAQREAAIKKLSRLEKEKIIKAGASSPPSKNYKKSISKAKANKE